MTLSTNISILLPEDHKVDPQDALRIALEALMVAGGEWNSETETWDKPYTEDSSEIKYPILQEPHQNATTGVWYGGSKMGQGFHAIVSMEWKDNGRVHEKAITNRELYPEDYKGEEDSPYGDKLAWPVSTFTFDFDTAYGASFSEDIPATGCFSLHVIAIAIMAEWAKDHGGTVMFEDESTGDWHNADKEGFKELAASGRAAITWFTNLVVPAITAEAAMSGGKITWNG